MAMITADAISRIVGFRPDGMPVVSMYARVEPGGSRRELHTRVSSLLDQIRPLVKDGGLAHEARMSLRADSEGIKEALAEEQWQPGAGPILS
jgi:peptide chain release factor subunit 1